MNPQAKCPKCGMVQMARATCKACGTALGDTTQHLPLVRSVSDVGMGETRDPNWLQRNRKLLMLGGMGVFLVFAGIYGVRIMSIRAEAKRQVEAARQEAARQVEAERRVANETLQTLRGLQSVTTAGIAYREYARRVLDAKIQVDRYLQADGGDPEVKLRVHQALTLYVFAASAWNAKIQEKRFEAVAENPAIELCPLAKSFRDETVEEIERENREYARTQPNYPIVLGHENLYSLIRTERPRWKGRAVSSSMPLLWECASDKIAEAELLLKDRS